MGNKITILDFFATWCGPCKMILPTLQALKDDYTDSIDIQKIDVEQDIEYAAFYGIRSVPTLVFLVGNEERARTVGYVSKAQLEKIIESLR
jgi:thioredoxin 1